MTTIGAITREQVDLDTALEETMAFLAATERIRRAEMSVNIKAELRKEYDRLAAEKEANSK